MSVYERRRLLTSVQRRVFGSRTYLLIAGLAFLFCAPGCDGQKSAPQSDRVPEYENLTSAVADAMSVEDPLARAAQLATALQGFNEESLGEVREAQALIEGGLPGSQTVELALLVDWWARYDPDGAFTWLKTNRRQGNPVILTSLVYSWASREPVFASMGIEVLSPRQQEAHQVVSALVQGWNASGAPGLEEYLIGLRSDVSRQIALTDLAVDKVKRGGIDDTILWVEALPDGSDGDFKQLAYRRVAGAIAGVDPIRAAAWVESERDGPWRDGLARAVSQKWAQEDGQAAMEWLRGLPDPESIDVARAFEESYRTWLTRDREAARAWLPEQELDVSLDPVLAVYSRSLAREDPESAIPWAGRITEPVRREETLEKIAQAWMHQNPAAASAWLEKGEIPEVAVRRIHASLERSKERARQRASRKRPKTGQ